MGTILLINDINKNCDLKYLNITDFNNRVSPHFCQTLLLKSIELLKHIFNSQQINYYQIHYQIHYSIHYQIHYQIKLSLTHH